MHHRRIAGIGLLAALLSAAFPTVRAAAAPGRQDLPPRPGATPIIVVGLPNLNPPAAPTAVPPHSSPAAPTRPAVPPSAVKVALTNGYVKVLLRGKSYRVTSVKPWSAGSGKLVSIGFYHPITLGGTWMTAGKGTYRATYRNVHGLKVYVNMSRRRVAGIAPA